MKVLKQILRTLIIMALVLAVIGLFLPTRYQVQRSIRVKGSPDVIFTYINTLKKWPEWTAWTVQRFPDMKLAYEGPEAGAGAAYSWSGKTSGDGHLKIIESKAGNSHDLSYIRYDLDFEHGKYRSTGSLFIEPGKEAVKVTWFNAGDLGKNPFNRWFGLVMDRMMGPDMETGLNNLKAKVETK